MNNFMWCTDKETENILQFICKIKLSDETRNLSDLYIFDREKHDWFSVFFKCVFQLS